MTPECSAGSNALLGGSGIALNSKDARSHNSIANTWSKGPNSLKPIRGRKETHDSVHTDRQLSPRPWIERTLPTSSLRTLAFVVLFLVWSLTFIILSDSSIPPVEVDGTLKPVLSLSCTDSFWPQDGSCGINGVNCGPFSEASIVFHCPAGCASAKIERPYHVGDQTVQGRPLVIGGSIYRGDSYICASAVHDGTISDSKGGCGVVKRYGQTNSFPGSLMHGIESIAVRTYFPLTFRFPVDSAIECSPPREMRTFVLAASMVFTAILTVFSTWTSVTFFSTLLVGLVQVVFVSDPQSSPSGKHLLVSTRPEPSALGLGSSLLTILLPTGLCAVLIYKRIGRRAFTNMTAEIESSMLWFGSFWLGILSNHACAWSPGHELAPQSIQLRQCVVALIVVGLAVCYQACQLLNEGRLAKSSPPYIAFSLLFAAYVALPGVGLPIHFLILAVLLLPGPGAAQTRMGYVLQGILLGLFVHSIAHYEFFPPVAASSNNLQGSDQLVVGALEPRWPRLLDPVILLGNAESNITFTFTTPIPPLVEGISMVVNDVERARRLFADPAGSGAPFEWSRPPQAVADYFRFSWIQNGRPVGYGDANTWFVNGSWSGAVNVG
jgi:hypothetical protein